jgi:hypothetical protein
VARDLLLGESARSWSRGSLPTTARGYVPRKWWTEAEAEAEVQKLEKSGGLFGGRLTRAEAEKKVLADMRARKIGITTSAGSVLLPDRQQKAIFAKVDDVRFDVRRVGKNVGTAVLVLSAALGAVAVASVYRTSKGK